MLVLIILGRTDEGEFFQLMILYGRLELMGFGRGLARICVEKPLVRKYSEVLVPGTVRFEGISHLFFSRAELMLSCTDKESDFRTEPDRELVITGSWRVVGESSASSTSDTAESLRRIKPAFLSYRTNRQS